MSWVSKTIKKVARNLDPIHRIKNVLQAGKDAIGYVSGAKAIEAQREMAEEQAKLQAQQLAQAQRQAQVDAANVQQVQNSGTESALAQILKKRSALQRSIRTQGQQRLGD